MKLPPALVLTAGLGTRLWPLTLHRAKPATPVAGVSLTERVLRQLVSHGVGRAVLNLHHLPASITRLVGDGSHLNLQVTYSWEPRLLGSAGGPRHALPLLDSGTVLVVNGDTLSGVALNELAAHHQTSGALVTLAVIPQERPGHYGGVITDDGDAVTGFAKPGDTRAKWHFVGVQMVESSVFAGLEDGCPADSVSGIYTTLLSTRPGAVKVWRTTARFLDIGTPRDYLNANLTLAAQEGVGLPLIGQRCVLGARTELIDCVVWDDVTVGAGSVLERCVVSDGACIPPGRRYADAVLAVAPAETAPRPGVVLEDGLLVCSLGP